MLELICTEKNDFNQYILDQTEYFIAKNEQSETIALSSSFSKIAGYKNPIDYLGLNDYSMKCPAVCLANEFIAKDKRIFEHKSHLLHLTVTTYHNRDIGLYLDTKQYHHGIMCCNFWQLNHSTFSKHFYNQLKKVPLAFRNKVHHYYEIIDQYPHLTTRQSTVLYYLMLSKSSTEISQLLHLSPRTVQHYIENIKFIMNCKSSSELIEMSLFLRLNEKIPCKLLGIANTAQFLLKP